MKFLLFILFFAYSVYGLDPVQTDLGPVRGHYNAQGIIEYQGDFQFFFRSHFEYFVGLRFARAPVDELRFEIFLLINRLFHLRRMFYIMKIVGVDKIFFSVFYFLCFS